MAYALRVKFKSNEAPWSGGYEPAARHQPEDDAAAIKWAVEISDGLGLDYLVILTKDDSVIPLPLRELSDVLGEDGDQSGTHAGARHKDNPSTRR